MLKIGDNNPSSELFVSTYTPAVMHVRTNRTSSNSGSSTNWNMPGDGEIKDERILQEAASARAAAEECGFHWIGGDLAGQVVPKLNIYFFGSRDPLSIRDLLFYWQD